MWRNGVGGEGEGGAVGAGTGAGAGTGGEKRFFFLLPQPNLGDAPVSAWQNLTKWWVAGRINRS